MTQIPKFACAVVPAVSPATVPTIKCASPASQAAILLPTTPVSPATALASPAKPQPQTVSPVLLERLLPPVLAAAVPGTALRAQTQLHALSAKTASSQPAVSAEAVLPPAPAAMPPTSPNALPAQADSTSQSPSASLAERDASPAATVPHARPVSPDTLPTQTESVSSAATPPV